MSDLLRKRHEHRAFPAIDVLERKKATELRLFVDTLKLYRSYQDVIERRAREDLTSVSAQRCLVTARLNLNLHSWRYHSCAAALARLKGADRG